MMLADADLAAVAELMSANRATLLLALLGGRALTAGELAGRARISRSLASSQYRSASCRPTPGLG